MIAHHFPTGLRRIALALLLIAPGAATAADQRSFPSPEAAVDALVDALGKDDEAGLVAIFGEKHRSLVSSGDRQSDAAERARIAGALQDFRSLDDDGADRRILLLGLEAWPAPIPIVREAGGWRFATELGYEEILNRRIGANERHAIYALRAYVDAQRQYASVDRDGDGVLQYAQRLASREGRRDGLYWPTASDDEEASPFGPLIAASAAYLAGRREGDPYRGYHFRILTSQGAEAAGGPYNYVINGRMVAGFAMVAFPHEYGETGVMTFIVNQNGRIFEKDLGKSTRRIGTLMKSFNPGRGWKEVGP
ncbi:MAG: DUF2950 domain-containing protein [Alphaproteobacteria bacterium]